MSETTPEQNSEELRTVDAPAPDRAEQYKVETPQNETPVTEQAEPTVAGTVPGSDTPTSAGGTTATP